MSVIGAGMIIGGAAQLGQSIFSGIQGIKMMREAKQVKKPEFQVQQEFEQNRAMALNRYNASNPFIAQATNNLNNQTAAATIAAQQTASDGAAALQAITGANVNAQNQQANMMAQASQMKDAQFQNVMSANQALAADKNRVNQMQYADYQLEQQKRMAGQQNLMNAIGGIGEFGGDLFSAAAKHPNSFKDVDLPFKNFKLFNRG